MNPTVAKNERDALRIRGGFQRNVIYALIGLASLQAFGIGWLVVNQTVAIVPPEVRRPYEIGSNYGNKDYLGDMANYVLQQILTVSADSVDFQNKVILKMTDPDAYGKLKAELDAAALRIRKDRISTVWTARKETISEQAKSVRVSGSLKTYIADVLTSTRDKEYIVDFYITSSGRLYVANVQEVVKPDPAASRPSR
jgi:conjugal transfer pilus assembly protein TraE